MTDQPAARRGPHDARARATRSRLLRIARVRFAGSGYPAVSLTDICTAAGMTKGAVYHHFSDKAALLDAVVTDLQRRLRGRVRRASAGHPTPCEKLHAGCLAYLSAVADPRAAAQLIYVDAPAVLGWARWSAIDDEFFATDLRAAVRAAAVEAGTGTDGAAVRSPSTDPDVRIEAVSLAIGATLTRSALDVVTAPDPRAAVRAAEATLDTLLTGLGTLLGR